jgi:hypothetical protein
MKSAMICLALLLAAPGAWAEVLTWDCRSVEAAGPGAAALVTSPMRVRVDTEKSIVTVRFGKNGEERFTPASSATTPEKKSPDTPEKKSGDPIALMPTPLPVGTDVTVDPDTVIWSRTDGGHRTVTSLNRVSGELVESHDCFACGLRIKQEPMKYACRPMAGK